MYFPSVQFFLTSMFSWDYWDPDFLVAQVMFALFAALLLVRFAHLLVYLYLVLFSCCNLVYIFVSVVLYGILFIHWPDSIFDLSSVYYTAFISLSDVFELGRLDRAGAIS